jgi:hypothetical protein
MSARTRTTPETRGIASTSIGLRDVDPFGDDGVPNGGKQRDERIAYRTLDTSTTDGTRDRLRGASPTATELP